MNNLQCLLCAWRKTRHLVFSENLPKDYSFDLTSAYDHLTNVLMDCLDCDDIDNLFSTISK